MTFKIKRVYEPAEKSDGIRVLVDRLWPRGLRKEDSHLDHWMKDVAPTPKLRTWFGHQENRFEDFSRRYRIELADNPAVASLRRIGAKRSVTLLYAARDPTVNHARVLLSFLQRKNP
jgi:uncharacterized protein YeaO (DUF488 family)